MKKYYCPNCERQQEFCRYDKLEFFFAGSNYNFGGCTGCGVIVDLTITTSEEEAQESLKKAQKALGLLEVKKEV